MEVIDSFSNTPIKPFINNPVHKATFLRSELELNNQFQPLDEFLKWFDSRKSANRFSVELIPFSKLDKWHFTWRFGAGVHSLVHDSGRFYKIKGIRVLMNGESWDQPIIDQPEIGILGVITKKFNGVRYFLMQAKMEPGNINLIQLSPTVQATKSNYTQVHRGTAPKYIEYFLDSSKSKVLIDHLQTEHGRRFLRKRNRNIIVEVEEDVPVYEDFKWLTLGELKKLVGLDNLVNVDSRSVLSCINFLDEEIDEGFIDEISDDFKRGVFTSMISDKNSLHSLNDIIHWFTEMKANAEVTTEEVPLNEVRGWSINDDGLRHGSGKFFSVVGVSVIAGNREVGSWTQPLIKHNSHGLIGFLCKKINGVLHFLVQAKAEPGSFTVMEMVPAVECDDIDDRINRGQIPKFSEFFINASKDKIKFDAFESEEGGRFYKCHNRCMVVETDSNFDIPKNYHWMTLNQIMSLIKHNYFNIDARNLLTYLSLK